MRTCIEKRNMQSRREDRLTDNGKHKGVQPMSRFLDGFMHALSV